MSHHGNHQKRQIGNRRFGENGVRSDPQPDVLDSADTPNNMATNGKEENLSCHKPSDPLLALGLPEYGAPSAPLPAPEADSCPLLSDVSPQISGGGLPTYANHGEAASYEAGAPPPGAPPPPPPAYADDVGCWAGWKREPHLKCLTLTLACAVVLGL